MYETLLIADADRVRTVTINRPKALNALNRKVFEELAEVFERAAADVDVRVVVIKGAGGRAFVAGADIKEFNAMTPAEAEARSWQGMRLYDQMRRLPKPVVASIDGYALGGGMLLAMACDVRVAAETATFGYPEIRLGIFPGTGGTVLLDRLIGPAAARGICLLGDRFSAERAYQLGLVSRLAPADELATVTDDVAAVLAGYSPVAIRELKSVLNASLERDFEAARVAEVAAYGRCFASDDRKEGVRAFIEKRTPTFVGR